MRWKFSIEDFYRFIATSLTHLVYRPLYLGFENIPPTGPGILISNHVSYMDGPLINAAVGRQVRYIIDEDIYNLPGVNYIMKLARAIPIAPNRTSVAKAMDEVSAALRAGELVCIFPEGQLTFTGSLSRFKPGIDWMLKRDPVPIYPIAINGMWGSVFSRKYMKSLFRWFPREWGHEVTLICGPAIDGATTNFNALQQAILKLKYSLHDITN